MTTVPTANTAERAEADAPASVADVVLRRVLAAAIIIAFVFLFHRWFWTQHLKSWKHLEDWGHAYAIPLISIYLLWQHRDRVLKIRPETFWPGLAPFLLGIMSYFFCLVSVRNHMLQGFSVVLTLFGLVLLIFGPRAMRLLFIPIAYLAFAITVSESIMIAITFKLQLLASQGSWLMLNVIGKPFGWFSVDIDGNTLQLITSAGEIIPLNVAEACSGMRMVVAFFALAVAVALIACRHWWQRIALFLLAAPVAILMNMVRVTVLGLASLISPDLAAGDAHTIIGTILLFPSLLLFLGVVWTLNRLVREPSEFQS